MRRARLRSFGVFIAMILFNSEGISRSGAEGMVRLEEFEI